MHQIPGFYLLESVGEGGFGWVYKGLSLQTGTVFAVKVLRSPDSDTLERFRREIRIVEKLKGQRFIVTVYAHDLSHNPPYYVMELCNGSIADILRTKGALSWKVAAAFLAQAADGLRALHEAGGFHRDIKPANLLLSNDSAGWPTVRLADFGLARYPSADTGPMTHQPAGTPGYMSPEILSGEPFTIADDVYSLGVTGIEMLTLKAMPYGIPTHGIPTRLQSLLTKMVGPRAERPSTATVCRVCVEEIKLAGIKPAPQPSAAPSNSGGRADNLAGLLIGALIIAGIALAASD